MTAYVVAAEPIEVNSANYFIATLGLYRLGYFVERFQLQELSVDEISRDTPVFGGIESIQKVFPGYVGLPYYPAELADYLKRKIEIKQIVDVENGQFFKPLEEEHKLFTPRVKDDSFDCEYLLGRIPIDTKVITSDAIAFSSEFRVYVLNGEILDICFYKGDPLILPNTSEVAKMVKGCWHYSAAFGLDVGVTLSGETVVVELNDFCCLGNYGLRPLDYGRSIVARWEQIWDQYRGG